MSFKDHIDEIALEIDLLGSGEERTCEWCGVTSKRVIDTPSQTMYQWDGQGDDPNRHKQLCIECAVEYTYNIEAQWAEYYSGRL